MTNMNKIMRTRLSAMELIARGVMKSGQGAAVCKAGTSTISTVIKRSSRVIKNAL